MTLRAKMQIAIGPMTYDVCLVEDWIDHEGEPCLGLCDHVAQRILISKRSQPDRRVNVFFHELAHAWQRVFNVGDVTLDEERMADVIGLAMADLKPATLGRVIRFVATGKDLPHMFIPGSDWPIPLVGGVD